MIKICPSTEGVKSVSQKQRMSELKEFMSQGGGNAEAGMEFQSLLEKGISDWEYWLILALGMREERVRVRE